MAKRKGKPSAGERKRGCMPTGVVVFVFACLFLSYIGSQAPRSTTNRSAAQPTQTTVQPDTNQTGQVATAIAGDRANPTPTSDDSSPLENITLTREDGVGLEIEHFEVYSEIGQRTPRNGDFLVMFAILHNNSNRSQCVYARDVRLYLDGEAYAPQNGPMTDLKETLEPERDFIGAYAGQCLDRNTSEPTFAVFDVASEAEAAALSFSGHSRTIAVSWLEEMAVIADAAIPTTTPSATITDTPTPTPTSTEQPPQTYYTTSNARARQCPETSCDIVATIPAGTAVSVIGVEEGDAVSGNTTWRRVTYNGQDVYIHSSLLSLTRPQPRPTSPPAQEQQVQPPPQQEQPVSTPVPPPVSTPVPQGPSFSCSCSKTCGQMASCEEAYFQLNQCGCGQRDADNDGVPCEDICPGG